MSDNANDENGNLANLKKLIASKCVMVRPSGKSIPRHTALFRIDELVNIKDYTFRVKYVGETSILFEPESVCLLSPEDQEATGRE